MSSSDRLTTGRRVTSRRGTVAVLAAIVVGGLVAACGFRPMYGTGAGGSVVPAEFQETRIEPLTDRDGQILHNMLRDRLNPTGQPARPAYRLRIRLDQDLQRLALREDETATRANLDLSARYRLIDADGETVLTSGVSRATVSYNIVDSEFATVTSRHDARDRGLRLIADDVERRLGVYFAAQRANSQ